MSDALTCETCAFWRPVPRTTLGDCDLQVVYGRVAFDYQPCMYHSGRATTPAPVESDMQSQARPSSGGSRARRGAGQAGPMTYQGWVRKITKP